MKTFRKAVFATIAVVGIGAIGAVAVASAAREIGRSDPKRAANYRLPLFNFSETYTDGVAYGVAVDISKAEAIEATKRAGLTVQSSCWGDNRAGGADLYEKSELTAIMLRQRSLCFFDEDDLKGGMIMDFRGDRVAAIHVHYINFGAI